MRLSSMGTVRSACLTIVIAGVVAGCSSLAPAPAEHASVPADFPQSHYRQMEALGKPVLRVDPQRSLLAIKVRRAGPLARLGHDHIVASHDLRGYVAPDEGRSDLYVALDRLTVDEPALRAEAGFDTQPSPEAIEGTRRNMLEKVLDVQRFPFALIRATRAEAADSTLRVSITLHGTSRTFEVPVRIETVPHGIAVSGRMSFNQTDFGMTPFSVLGGALQVQDRLDLRFRIVAGE